MHALGHVAAGDPAEERLARGADHERAAEAVSSSSRAQQLEVVLERLAEADPGVELDRAPRARPARDRGVHPLLQERLDVGDDVVVARVVLHRARLAEHVHQAAVEAAVGDEAGQLRLVPEGGDVVDVGRARVDRRLGDGELHRVDRDRARRRASPATTGTTRSSSSSTRHRLGAGAGGLAADVEDRGALGGQPAAVVDGLRGVVELPAVREGVGRDVDHAHDLEGHRVKRYRPPEGGGTQGGRWGIAVVRRWLPGGRRGRRRQPVGVRRGSSRTTGTTKVWGVRVRSGRGARRVMVGESEEGCCLIRRFPSSGAEAALSAGAAPARDRRRRPGGEDVIWRRAAVAALGRGSRRACAHRVAPCGDPPGRRGAERDAERGSPRRRAAAAGRTDRRTPARPRPCRRAARGSGTRRRAPAPRATARRRTARTARRVPASASATQRERPGVGARRRGREALERARSAAPRAPPREHLHRGHGDRVAPGAAARLDDDERRARARPTASTSASPPSVAPPPPPPATIPTPAEREREAGPRRRARRAAAGARPRSARRAPARRRRSARRG